MTFISLLSFVELRSQQHDNLAADDTVTEYEWLYKDAPCSVEGVPLICIYGWQHINVELGTYPLIEGNAASNIRTVGSRVDVNEHFILTARLYDKSGWPMELGFKRLGEILSVLAYEEVPWEHWNELRIFLPHVELPFDTSAPVIIPLSALKNLQRLKWTGHRKQLLNSWLPFAPAVLRSLTSLHLTTELALQDCAHILFHGTSLQDVTFNRIFKGFADEPILPFHASGVRSERPCLESLTLTSDDDIGPLVQPFTCPSLHHVEFHLSYTTISRFHHLDFWKTLQTAVLDFYVSEEDADWIRGQCPSTATLEFTHYPGSYAMVSRPINGVSRYMFNRHSRIPLAGVLGVSFVGLALWLYAHKTSKERAPGTVGAGLTTSASGATQSTATAAAPAAVAPPITPTNVTTQTTTAPIPAAVASQAAVPPAMLVQPTALAAPSTATPPAAALAPPLVIHPAVTVAPPAAVLPAAAAAAALPPPAVPPILIAAAAQLAVPLIAAQPAPHRRSTRVNPQHQIRRVPDTNKTITVTLDPEIRSIEDVARANARCTDTLHQHSSAAPAELDVEALFPSDTPEIDWSAENLRKFGRAFGELRQHDSDKCCTTLIVELPKSKRVSREDNAGVNYLSLPGVRTLTWTSHQNQLPLLFNPNLPQHERSPLTTLTLNGEFALWDCAGILREFAGTLKTLTIRKLVGDDNALSVLNTTTGTSAVMVALKTLDIDSDFSPGTILNYFSFPVMTTFNLTTRRSKLSFFTPFYSMKTKEFKTIVWNNLEESTINGDFDHDSEQVQRDYPHGHHGHTHTPMIR
ncbi:hypothetical protein DXG01_006235 [Tephrocybe rancida]|nr:hypothetical protein DXG01_006235 [Tephrocybe rancida]